VVCWAGVAPVLEIVLYNESMDLIFAQGLTAAIANTVTTAIVGSALLLTRTARRTP
jgi:energy-coupling factor transport system substrate-specific component